MVDQSLHGTYSLVRRGTYGRVNAILQIRSAPTIFRRYSEQKDCYRIALGRRGDLLSRGHRRRI